jgi:dehydrogenase/reductase SDR family member 7B
VHAPQHYVLPLDVARADTFPLAVSEALQFGQRIDVLVNNAGVSQRALATDATLEVERALMEVNYFGPVALTKAVLPGMRSRRSGHVVVVSSVMGYLGTPGRSTYAAAKHALHGYFDSLRAEVWRENISVTLACPGYVRTAVSANALGPRGVQHAVTDKTHRKAITAERCADAILRGIARRKREIYVGGWEIAGIYLQRFAPGLLARIVRRMRFSVDAERR